MKIEKKMTAWIPTGAKYVRYKEYIINIHFLFSKNEITVTSLKYTHSFVGTPPYGFGFKIHKPVRFFMLKVNGEKCRDIFEVRRSLK
jgi:hypothetical protein